MTRADQSEVSVCHSGLGGSISHRASDGLYSGREEEEEEGGLTPVSQFHYSICLQSPGSSQSPLLTSLSPRFVLSLTDTILITG